jgi:Protein of unknown function (DUF1579)
MRVKVLMAGALLLVCSAVFAQDAAMMEAMNKAATPSEPHKKLDVFAGTWDTKLHMWMAPGTPPMTITGTSENRWTLGGRYLEQRFKGSFMNTPFEGVGYTGYDNVKKQYWGSWMDNMSTAMTVTTGWMPDAKTWLFSGSMTDPMTGKDARMEERITVTDADHHVLEMFGPTPDGTMYKMMEVHYARKK